MPLFLFLFLALFTQTAHAATEAEIKEYIDKHPEVFMSIMKQHPVTLFNIVKEGSEILRKRNLLQSFVDQHKKGKIPEISATDRVIIGNVNAKTTIFLFTDFTCHFCSKTVTTLFKMLPKLKDRVRIVIKAATHGDFKPGLNAFKTLYAVNEVSPDKTQSYILSLYEDQREFFKKGDQYIEESIKKIGLDPKTIIEKSSKYETRINNDLEEGKKYNIHATPTLFVNAIRIEGNLPEEMFSAAIDIAEGFELSLHELK